MYNPYNWEIKKDISKEDVLRQMADIDCRIISLHAELRDLEREFESAREKLEYEIEDWETKKDEMWEKYRKLYI